MFEGPTIIILWLMAPALIVIGAIGAALAFGAIVKLKEGLQRRIAARHRLQEFAENREITTDGRATRQRAAHGALQPVHPPHLRAAASPWAGSDRRRQSATGYGGSTAGGSSACSARLRRTARGDEKTTLPVG